MRKPRLKAPPYHDHAYYHCISRVVDRQFILGDTEKEQFLTLLREYARFCGIQIITYCLMSNHFHLLVKVPKPPSEPLSDDQLLRRLEALSGMTGAATLRQRLETFRANNQHDAAEALRQTILARMHDVSAFMKLLKQRFAAWYNRRHGRKGTLWEERFKSVLIESAGPALATIAAYIDLNPVRAKLVDLPEHYRWCGYAEALGSTGRGKAGYREIFRDGPSARSDVMATYRQWLYGQGEQNEGFTENGQPIRLGLDPDKVKQIMAEKGRMSLGDYLRCKVRYFTDGLVFGSRGYVDEIFLAMRERFGPKRKNGARLMAGVDRPFFTLRALRVRPVG